MATRCLSLVVLVLVAAIAAACDDPATTPDATPDTPSPDAPSPDAPDAPDTPDADPPDRCEISDCQDGVARQCGVADPLILECDAFGAACADFTSDGVELRWCDCGELDEDEERCVDDRRSVRCFDGRAFVNDCDAGYRCAPSQVNPELVDCECADAADGVCPEGCPDDPDCGCEPSCAGRECGDDGCGGACGTCDGGLTCSNEGTCGCGFFDQVTYTFALAPQETFPASFSFVTVNVRHVGVDGEEGEPGGDFMGFSGSSVTSFDHVAYGCRAHLRIRREYALSGRSCSLEQVIEGRTAFVIPAPIVDASGDCTAPPL